MRDIKKHAALLRTAHIILLASIVVLSACNDVPQLDASDAPASTYNVGNSESESWWQPRATDRLTWQWQLQGEVDISLDADVYNLDIDTPVEKIRALKSRGVRVICYFSAGTVESWRGDTDLFPESIIGEEYQGYEDERWIDYGNYSAFADVIRARMDTCKAKGFDAIETDNVDGHNYETHDEDGKVSNIGTSFKITLEQSIAYIRWLADEAHSRGLSIGLKNAEEMASVVVRDVDWMLTEDCFADNWCQTASVFIENNKPVFMTEYDDVVPDFAPACQQAKSLGFFAIWRTRALSNGTYRACK